MSKVFFDHLIEFDKLHSFLKKLDIDIEEKEELWALIDEIIHHRIVGCILDKLPENHHENFLNDLFQKPYSEELLDAVDKNTDGDMSEHIKNEMKKIESEIIEEIMSLRQMS